MINRLAPVAKIDWLARLSPPVEAAHGAKVIIKKQLVLIVSLLNGPLFGNTTKKRLFLWLKIRYDW